MGPLRWDNGPIGHIARNGLQTINRNQPMPDLAKKTAKKIAKAMPETFAEAHGKQIAHAHPSSCWQQPESFPMIDMGLTCAAHLTI